MAREKPKIVNHVSINGKDVLWDSLPKEEQKKIGMELNKRALESIGYKMENKIS